MVQRMVDQQVESTVYHSDVNWAALMDEQKVVVKAALMAPKKVVLKAEK